LTVLVLETGMGAAATDRALEWLLGAPLLGKVPYRPRVVVSAGFCGGLRSDLTVGDVVLATEVVDDRGGKWPTPWPGDLPPGRWEPALHRGRMLTVPAVVAAPREKRRLQETHDAVAVDMETAAAARWCQREGIPFGCVRAVSDAAEDGLSPGLAAALAGGRVSALRLAAGLVRSPSMVRELWRLARHTARAGERLAAALGELLTLTLPGGADL
jgi:adenosylhomocysteine nucleosidase